MARDTGGDSAMTPLRIPPLCRSRSLIPARASDAPAARESSLVPFEPCLDYPSLKGLVPPQLGSTRTNAEVDSVDHTEIIHNRSTTCYGSYQWSGAPARVESFRHRGSA